MNDARDAIARTIGLDAAPERLRLEFAHACAVRVERYIESGQVMQCLSGLGAYLTGSIDRSELAALAVRAARLAQQHPGSRSLDGCGHAAVSASYAVAHALAGQARQAASYAAYAMVYGEGGQAAVADRETFEIEFSWQAERLSRLVEQQGLAADDDISGRKSDSPV